jgi:hypothetical protein
MLAFSEVPEKLLIRWFCFMGFLKNSSIDALRIREEIKHARRARRFTPRQPADEVTKDDGTSMSPQYLNDIELHHRVPTPHVLCELRESLYYSGN